MMLIANINTTVGSSLNMLYIENYVKEKHFRHILFSQKYPVIMKKWQLQ